MIFTFFCNVTRRYMMTLPVYAKLIPTVKRELFSERGKYKLFKAIILKYDSFLKTSCYRWIIKTNRTELPLNHIILE